MTIDHLLVDTGSSNTWIGANASNPYVPTESSRLTGDGFVSHSIISSCERC